MKISVIALAGIGVLATCATQAQQPAQQQEMAALRAACKGDAKKLCSNVEPGGGHMRDCLMAHKDQLSPSCKTALQSAAKEKQSPH